MTKHKMTSMSVLDLHYTTELHPKALACLSGTKFEDYDVPRTRVNFVVNLDDIEDDQLRNDLEPMQDIVRLVFPMYDDLLDQLESSRADPGESAFHFVEEVMPFLANVLVQDGIFFTHQFPNHPISRLLLHRLPPGYPRIAQHFRELVYDAIDSKAAADRSDSHHKQQVTATLNLIAEQIENMNTKINRLDQKINQFATGVQREFQTVRHVVRQAVVTSGRGGRGAVARRGAVSGRVVVAGRGGQQPQQQAPSQQQQPSHTPLPRPRPPVMGRTGGRQTAVVTPQRTARPLNVNMVMTNQERESPVFPLRCWIC
jgi:hypothetical protein